MLHRLIYVSKATKQVSFESIQEICKKSAISNKKLGITGLLIFNRKYFIQLIEGDRSALSQVMFKIYENPLHYDIELIDFSPAESRMFTYFGAKMFAESNVCQELFFRYTSSVDFNPYQINSATAATLVAKLAGVEADEKKGDVNSKVTKFTNAS